MEAPSDEAWMDAALGFGRRALGRSAPNPAVGALIVKDGALVARGVTGPGGRPHAETQALEAAGDAARGATLYATLEPCAHRGETPPCAEAIVAAGVARVVTAMQDPDPRVSGKGHDILRSGGIEVVTGVREALARRDHLGHMLRVTQGRPMVTLKLAQTRDGFAAGAPHDPRLTVTGPLADAQTHMERAAHDAIMIGAGTAREDDPLLTVRLPGMEDQQRLRVVIDGNLTLSPRSRFAALARTIPTLVIALATTPDATVKQFCEATGAEVARVDADPLGRVVPRAALAELARRGVTRVFCEGGPRLAESLLAAGLVDVVMLHTGPKALGGSGRHALRPAARAVLEDPALYRLTDAFELGPDKITHYERVG